VDEMSGDPTVLLVLLLLNLGRLVSVILRSQVVEVSKVKGLTSNRLGERVLYQGTSHYLWAFRLRVFS